MDDQLDEEPVFMDDDAQNEDADVKSLARERVDAPPPPSYGLNGLGMDNATDGSGDAKRWLVSLEKSIRAIVSIRLLSVRAFDGNGASFSVATGFVVDLARGIILTNRHVVTPGPVVADAIFLNKEEVDLVPIYRCGTVRVCCEYGECGE